MAELNERERKIVDLIAKLAEYADDETSAQGAIDGIIQDIQNNTKDNIHEMMSSAERDAESKDEDTPVTESEFSRKFNNMGMKEKLKMLSEISELSSRIGQVDSQECCNNPHHCTCHDRGNVGKLTFTRIREVKKPGKAHPTDAGIDFYVPDEKAWDDEFKKSVIDFSKNPDDKMVHFEVDANSGNQIIVVEPDAHLAIPSGIKTIIPQGLGMMFVNKSGIATKKKLSHSACLVDSEYRGEVIMCFFNHSANPITIEPGMKITQGLVVPVINLEMQEVLNCVYDEMGKDTDRGGGFGSTDSK